MPNDERVPAGLCLLAPCHINNTYERGTKSNEFAKTKIAKENDTIYFTSHSRDAQHFFSPRCSRVFISFACVRNFVFVRNGIFGCSFSCSRFLAPNATLILLFHACITFNITHIAHNLIYIGWVRWFRFAAAFFFSRRPTWHKWQKSTQQF